MLLFTKRSWWRVAFAGAVVLLLACLWFSMFGVGVEWRL
jgi:hypothetical protein